MTPHNHTFNVIFHSIDWTGWKDQNGLWNVLVASPGWQIISSISGHTIDNRKCSPPSSTCYITYLANVSSYSGKSRGFGDLQQKPSWKITSAISSHTTDNRKCSPPSSSCYIAYPADLSSYSGKTIEFGDLKQWHTFFVICKPWQVAWVYIWDTTNTSEKARKKRNANMRWNIYHIQLICFTTLKPQYSSQNKAYPTMCIIALIYNYHFPFKAVMN